MNRRVRGSIGILLISAAALVGWAAPAGAQGFISGSSGAQSTFPPTTPPGGTTTITVNLNDGKVTYFPSGQYAMLPSVPTGGFRDGVLNFTTISVDSTVTVTFTKNAANTPVVLLAQGAVEINGTISVSGGNGGPLGRPGPGGPGGFDGGPGGDGVTGTMAGAGLGPGGGLPGLPGKNCVGSGGSYGTKGAIPSSNCETPLPGQADTYGSPALRPIIGGSGGSGGSAPSVPGAAGGAGGGGGGALVLASTGMITIGSTGKLVADGGVGSTGNGTNALGGGGGSGGAIRLIATTISTSGSLSAVGSTTQSQFGAGKGGDGRIRLEAYTLAVPSGTRSPEATQGLPLSVFPAAGQPTLTIASVAGIAVPATPAGSFLTTPDILLPAGTSSVSVILNASNIPIGTLIQVTATPQSGTRTTATSGGLQGTLASSSATANLTGLSLDRTNVLTASATFPLVASAGGGPVYAGGEEITHVRVAAALGGSSVVTYLTRSGREIPMP